MANDVGNSPRTNANPRSVGAVENIVPYWGRPGLVGRYKGKTVRVMRTLVGIKTENRTEMPDADLYKGRVVRRTFRPPR